MEIFIKALTWSLVHSMWLGLIAALLTATIISVTRKSSSRLRYDLIGFVMILFLIAVIIAFISEYSQHRTYGDQGSSTSAVASVITTQQDRGVISSVVSWLESNSDLLTLTWFFFFLVNCIRLTIGLIAVERLRHHQLVPVSPEWKRTLDRLRKDLHINQVVELFESGLIKVPVAVRVLKPMILVPIGFFSNIPSEQVETILLHELGHIRRKDYLVNLLQRFAEAVFFFNPALLWISSVLREEREACCDDIVVEMTGQKRIYLNALVSFQEFSNAHDRCAMGFSSRKQYLLNRVRRIISKRNKRLNIAEITMLVGGVLVFSAFTYISTPKKPAATALPVAVEQFNVKEKQGDLLLKEIPADLPAPKKINATRSRIASVTRLEQIRKVIDTVPANKIFDVRKEKARILQEIKEVKDRIGEKKESIGVKKEQLKVKNDVLEEKILNEQIASERKELENERKILEDKRALLLKMNKQENDQKEEVREEQLEIKHELKKDLQHDEKKQVIEKNSDKKKISAGSSSKLFQDKQKNVLGSSKSNESTQQVNYRAVAFADIHFRQEKDASYEVNGYRPVEKWALEFEPADKSFQLPKTIPTKPRIAPGSYARKLVNKPTSSQQKKDPAKVTEL